MITEPTSEQIRFYRENGFAAIDGFLTTEELNHWQAATDEAVSQRLRAHSGLTNQGDTPTPAGDYYAKVFTQCLRLADTHDGMRKLIYDARIGKLAATLADVEGIRVWHDQALIKPSFGNPTAWHLDNPYWSFSSRDSISIWVALDDASLENGCMWYIPGSHRLTNSEKNSGIGMNMGDLFKFYPELAKIDPVPIPARAGTAVFHNGLTAHAAGPNMTRRPRRAMTCAFMPDGATFNGTKNILPDEYFNRLKVGDVLDDPKQNPLIWSRQ